jgi:hypothetical protein
MEVLVVLAVINVIAILVTVAVAASKSRSLLGFFLFALLFWPGALICALIISPGDQRPPANGALRGDGLRAPAPGDNRTTTCAACQAATPVALSFCTSCRAPRSAVAAPGT